jgi:hypothetical protein
MAMGSCGIHGLPMLNQHKQGGFSQQSGARPRQSRPTNMSDLQLCELVVISGEVQIKVHIIIAKLP